MYASYIYIHTTRICAENIQVKGRMYIILYCTIYIHINIYIYTSSKDSTRKEAPGEVEVLFQKLHRLLVVAAAVVEDAQV